MTHSPGRTTGTFAARCSSPTIIQKSSSEHAIFPPTSIQLSHVTAEDPLAASALVDSSPSVEPVRRASAFADSAVIWANRSSQMSRIPSIRTLASRFARERCRLSNKPRSRRKRADLANEASSSASVSFPQSSPSGAKTGLTPCAAYSFAVSRAAGRTFEYLRARCECGLKTR